jgi:hypothetical protein
MEREERDVQGNTQHDFTSHAEHVHRYGAVIEDQMTDDNE